MINFDPHSTAIFPLYTYMHYIYVRKIHNKAKKKTYWAVATHGHSIFTIIFQLVVRHTTRLVKEIRSILTVHHPSTPSAWYLTIHAMESNTCQKNPMIMLNAFHNPLIIIKYCQYSYLTCLKQLYKSNQISGIFQLPNSPWIPWGHLPRQPQCHRSVSSFKSADHLRYPHATSPSTAGRIERNDATKSDALRFRSPSSTRADDHRLWSPSVSIRPLTSIDFGSEMALCLPGLIVGHPLRSCIALLASSMALCSSACVLSMSFNSATLNYCNWDNTWLLIFSIMYHSKSWFDRPMVK
jgi:hypothetical protein